NVAFFFSDEREDGCGRVPQFLYQLCLIWAAKGSFINATDARDIVRGFRANVQHNKILWQSGENKKHRTYGIARAGLLTVLVVARWGHRPQRVSSKQITNTGCYGLHPM